MVNTCVIKSCSSKRKSKSKDSVYPNVSFFRPGTSARLKKWKISLGIELRASDTICHLHFKEEHVKMFEKLKINGEIKFIPLQKKVLKDGALPTIEHQYVPVIQESEHFVIEPIYSYNNDFENEQQNEVQQIKVEQDEDFLGNKLTFANCVHDHSYTNGDQDVDDSLLIPRAYIDLKDHWETEVITQSVETFKENIRNFTMLPPFWLYLEKPNVLEFMRMDLTTKRIKNHIRLNEDLSITVILRNEDEYPLKKKIDSYCKIYDYLKSVERWPLCVGTKLDNDRYSRDCKGVIIGNDAYKRYQQFPRCKSCRILRNKLKTRVPKTQLLQHVSRIVKQCKC